MFEGEYRNNIKFNGKLFDRYNNDIYEIKNGKGYVKLYSYFGELLYEGGYLNGEYNGKGKKYFNSYLIYEGEFLNGKKQGWGIDYSYFGKKFEGEIIDGKWKKGKEYKDGKLIYEGEFLNGKRNGKGKLYDLHYSSNELRYEGEFLNGKKNGEGKEYEDDGSKYEGEYSNGKKNGKGKKYIFTGNPDYQLLFEGEYYNNYRLRGKEYYKNDKLKFEGDYLFNQKWNGKLYDYNGNLIFELINGNAIIEEDDETIKILIGENMSVEQIIEFAKGKEYDCYGNS
jgi:hypothetical protein